MDHTIDQSKQTVVHAQKTAHKQACLADLLTPVEEVSFDTAATASPAW